MDDIANMMRAERDEASKPKKATRPLRIRVDCDGVLCDFTRAYLRVLEAQTGRAIFYNDVTQFSFRECVATAEEDERVWQTIDSTPGFVRGLERLPGARCGLELLRLRGQVTCVTSPHQGPTWVPERMLWLLNAGFSKREQIFTSDKSHVHGDVLIDDKIENLQEFGAENPGALLLLFDQPWNRKPLPPSIVYRAGRCHGWYDVDQQIRVYSETREVGK